MKKIVLLMLALLPAMAFAQGFQVNLADQKQIGMGHTGTGVAQSGAAIFFNPGAMAMLPENSVQAGISPLAFKSAFNPTGTNDVYHTSNKIATPFSGYAVFGPKSSWWKLGIGVYTPFGGLVNWGNAWEGKYVLESLDLKAIYFQPTLSIKLADFVSIGGGFVYNRGSVNLTRAIPLSDANGADGQAQLKGSGNGYGWNAGIYFKTEAGITVGIDYRSKVNTVIDGGNAIFKVPTSVQANFPQPNTFKASIPLPSTTSIGLGFYPSKQWMLSFDASLVSWHVYKALSFDYANNTSTLQDTYSPRLYRDAFNVRGGAQFKPEDKWAVRAGLGYVSAAAANSYVTPEVPDAERCYFTGGVGYEVAKRFDVDLSFEFEHFMSRTQTNIESQLSGTFRSNVYIPGISLTYHW